jgi:hypothetical protein
MKSRFVALFLLSALIMPTIVLVGCSGTDAQNGNVNSDVELNSPDNPKGKGLRKGAEGG